jgi:hypothetical protein
MTALGPLELRQERRPKDGLLTLTSNMEEPSKRRLEIQDTAVARRRPPPYLDIAAIPHSVSALAIRNA